MLQIYKVDYKNRDMLEDYLKGVDHYSVKEFVNINLFKKDYEIGDRKESNRYLLDSILKEPDNAINDY